MIVLLLRTPRTSGWGQSFWVVSLAVFAVSALHLSNHRGTDPWWLELVGHHSSVPLALAFLHQDYRFALADIFLKRAMALVVLVSIVFGIYLTGVTSLSDQQSIVVLVLWVSTALVYPWIRSLAGWFVDNVVLHRPDYDMLLAEASRAVARHERVDAILDELRQLLAAALSARSIEWSQVESLDLSEGLVSVASGHSVLVRIPTVDAPHYSLSITAFEGGRRLLSDDIAVIERLALVAARRIDAVRTTQERIKRNDREREMSRLAAEAELRALRAQLHPHFLFNALTTIGYLIQAAPDRALTTLMRLSGLLRSVLRSGPEFSTLGEELKFVTAYLDIENARFEDRLVVRINVDDNLKRFRIPGLLLQPLVENAIKHGISKSAPGGEIRITAELVTDRPRACLRLVVEDTGAGNDEASIVAGRQHGVGLNNIERRLQCYGGDSGVLRIFSKPGEGTRVEITLPAEFVESDERETLRVMEKAGPGR
jgi:signal transduction histidine kinase